MKNTIELPEGYEEIYKIDLKNDKKTAVFIHVVVFLIVLLMVIIGAIFVPIKTLFDFSDGLVVYYFRLLIPIAGIILLRFLLNLLTGIGIKCFINTKVHHGSASGFSYVGNDAYLNKKSHTIIAFTPVIVIGIILLIINCIVGISWFWCVYIIQVINIASTFTNAYIIYKFSKLPKDILIKDEGVSMTAYSQTR